MSNHALLYPDCFVNTSDQLRSVLPELKEFSRSSGLPGFRPNGRAVAYGGKPSSCALSHRSQDL
ncbi:hypothetical protein [Mastigocladopsis repens]|uniref:hypothetical protein n=1 Tax=Mastigocladopsis repens TaxID=221287 RepID=UPI001E5191A3|nr:hypothetical protein [Mastigocladopsis repens]